MFESIVVGTDGSERAARAVEAAVGLAATCHAHLHLVSAYRGVEATVATAMAAGPVVTPAVELGEAVKVEKAAELDALEKVAATARARDVEVTCHAVSGSPVTVLLDVAQQVGADCIVVGNRGMTGAKRILGSVPNTLSHHAECAILIVPTDDP